MAMRLALCPLSLILVACSDMTGGAGNEGRRVPEPDPSQPASPPGVTSNASGSVTARFEGALFTARLGTNAIHSSNQLGFAAFDGTGSPTVLVTFWIPATGPGVYATGVTGRTPFATVTISTATGSERWISTFEQGRGSVMLNLLTAEDAEGGFSFELVPDSATTAAGATGTRMLADGSFAVKVTAR